MPWLPIGKNFNSVLLNCKQFKLLFPYSIEPQSERISNDLFKRILEVSSDSAVDNDKVNFYQFH